MDFISTEREFFEVNKGSISGFSSEDQPPEAPPAIDGGKETEPVHEALSLSTHEPSAKSSENFSLPRETPESVTNFNSEHDSESESQGEFTPKKTQVKLCSGSLRRLSLEVLIVPFYNLSRFHVLFVTCVH